VIRTHFSPYHGPQFEQIERDRLQTLPGVTVVPLAQVDPNIPSVLITNTHTVLKDLTKGLLKQTKLILHSNSGYDHMKAEMDLWSDIPVVVGHEIRAQAVAEYSLSCLFEGLLPLPQHLHWSKDRIWERPQIKDQNIWVYGYGHIGKIVCETLKALGAQVTVVDPFVPTLPKVGSHRDANVVIVCSSLNKTSQHMFNEKFFQAAHPELIFINGARGKLVEEKALREFLLSHPKAQAFLDVFETEPFDSSWVSFPQVWKTSHIAGVYSGLDEGIVSFEEKVLSDFVSLNELEFNQKYKYELLKNKLIQGELI
jgi:D-3-phosphoglycerate dehydrogenase